MHRHGKRESLWAKILRFFMPAAGAHANPRETGEMPVLDEDDYSGFYDREGHWHEGVRDPDGPWGDDYDDDSWRGTGYIPSPGDRELNAQLRETRDLKILDSYNTPLSRPYLKRAA